MKLNTIATAPNLPSPPSSPAPRLSTKPSEPPIGNAAELTLWKSQWPDAVALLQELNDTFPPNTPPGSHTEVSLLKHRSSQLAVDPSLGSESGVPLDANVLDAQTLVMARPGNRETGAWAAACLHHDIRTVIDVSSPDATDKSCMKSNAPWVKGNTRVEFRCPTTPQGFAVETEGTLGHHASVERKVGLRHVVNGSPVSSRHDVAPSPWNNGSDAAAAELTWLRVPMSDRQTPSPRTLLALCARAEELQQDGGMVALQSADGGQQAGLVAVARELYQMLRTQPRWQDQLCDAVSQACGKGRAKISNDLIRRPEDVASLLTMGRMMLSGMPFRR
jgi:hypothetical protein